MIRIAVIGDVMMDKYVHGEVKRISPEAPVPVLLEKDYEYRLGGAANVAANISSLGASVSLYGMTGCRFDDGSAEWERLIDTYSIDDCTFENAQMDWPVKTRFVDSSGQQLIRSDRDVIQKVSHSDVVSLQEDLRRIPYDAVIISDYGKGVISQDMISMLSTFDFRLLLIDPCKSRDAFYYQKLGGIIKPNLSEAEELLNLTDGSSPVDKDDRLGVMARSLGTVGFQKVVITLGKDGVLLYDKENDFLEKLPATGNPDDVFDVSGAGDTFIAALAIELSSGKCFPDSVRLANKASGIVVRKQGTSVVTLEEVENHINPYAAKVFGVTHLQNIREEQVKVLFTNGCFDLLHPGHVKYLQEAKLKHGGFLVVAINSDKTIRELKGPDRPCINETDRAHLLASLDCVDGVIVFDEETPHTLLRLLRPDVLFKGGDYKGVEEVVGHEIVMEYGGCVELMPNFDGYSTSKLIDRLKE